MHMWLMCMNGKALDDWSQGKHLALFLLRHSLFLQGKKLSGTLRVKGKPNSQFLVGPVIKSFVIPPNLKLERAARKNYALDAGWQTICHNFKVHDLITSKSIV